MQNTVQYVTGKRIVEVFADLATVIPVRKKAKTAIATFSAQNTEEQEYEDVQINIEDYASVLVRFEDGSRGVFTVSQVSAGRKNRLSFEIDGSKSSVFWNQEEQEKLWIGHRDKARMKFFLRILRCSHQKQDHPSTIPAVKMKAGRMH
ncbi:MAG: Gfo/Idh/MocA family protein [Neobacillus sp.]